MSKLTRQAFLDLMQEDIDWFEDRGEDTGLSGPEYQHILACLEWMRYHADLVIETNQKPDG